jgi:hypothetical protein
MARRNDNEFQVEVGVHIEGEDIKGIFMNALEALGLPKVEATRLYSEDRLLVSKTPPEERTPPDDPKKYGKRGDYYIHTNNNVYAMAGLLDQLGRLLDKSVRVKVISPKEATDQAEVELLK